MTVIMIAEKPTSSKSIAYALAEGNSLKVHENEEGVRHYEFMRNGKKHIVVAAVGHLFTLKQKGKGWDYPVFDVEWIPSWKASRLASFSKKYFDVVEKIAVDGSDYIVCTDYDDEGEVIGANILKFLCKKDDAKRMKFSTMTKEELIDSYNNAENHLNKNLAEAGFTRHMMDWYFGINLTRALTNAIKVASKRFRILSTGRVQGPVLHMLSLHEKKIRSFRPKPFWQIELDVKVGRQILKAQYHKDKIWDKKTADRVLKTAKVKHATVKDIKKKIASQKPPSPYNTTSLLADIYRYFGYSPAQALGIAEVLYQSGYISYPRTSSEKLPKDINYKKILKGIGEQSAYRKDVNYLLSRTLSPHEGKRTDPAHPAVYPTGVVPERIGSTQKNVYDLVVRRFLAAFGDNAKRESSKVVLDVNGELFSFSGRRTIEAGWTALYGKYAQRDEVILPDVEIGEKLPIKKAVQIAKETLPPARFSQGSVLKEMQEKNLGTKATRAQILQILYNRGYLIGKSIEVTELGMSLSSILEKNAPDIVSEELTRHFETQCEKVELGKTEKEKILNEAKEEITKICNDFHKKEKKIGVQLTKAVIAAQDKQNILGPCPKCSGTIKVHKNWITKKRFAGCTGYRKGCRFGAPLPREGIIMSTEKTCPECKTPIIQVRRPASRPFRMCLALDCPTKKEWLDKKKLANAPTK